MTREKQIFFRLSTPFTAILSLRFLRMISGRKLILPFYHAISDEIPAHLRYLYRVRSLKEFESELDTLLKYYHPISLDELIALIAQDKHVDRPVLHISFDDGLQEFYQHAAPLLLKKGIPATCFVNNAFIDNREVMFRLKISFLIDHLHSSSAGSSSWVKFHDWVQKYRYGRTYYRKLLLGMKQDEFDRVEELAGILDLNFSNFAKGSGPYMSSSQIRELIDQGFTFGAHTFRHRDLRELNEEEQLDAVRTSVDDLCEQFGLKYRVFSFPFTDFGLGATFFERLFGEKICDLSFGCAGIKEDVHPANLQRIPVEEYPLNMLSALKKEYMYYNLLKLAGKSIIKR